MRTVNAIALLLASGISQAGPLRPGELVVTDRDRGTVLVVDPETGDRRVMSGGNRGEGPTLRLPTEVLVTDDHRVFVLTQSDDPIVEVDPLTGDRSVLVGVAAGDPVGCCDFRGLTRNGDGDLVSIDHDNDRLVFIDPDSGQRTLTRPVLGAGDFIADLWYADGVYYYAIGNPSQLRAIDFRGPPASRLVRILADDSYFDLGLQLQFPTAVAHFEGSLYSTSRGDALFSVLRFGAAEDDRERISASNCCAHLGWENPYERGTGPILPSVTKLAISPTGDMLATVRDSGILRIDLETGDRSVVTNANRGVGPPIGEFYGLAVVPVPEPSGVALLALALILSPHSLSRSVR